jgi:hypothetical protein
MVGSRRFELLASQPLRSWAATGLQTAERKGTRILVATFGNDPNHQPYESRASTCCVAKTLT